MSGRSVFSESEKVCLQELILKYKLNSVATIGAGNPAVKKTAWARLTEEYNSIETNSTRTETQLKKCWDNLKTRRKQALALEKRERMKTGGGSYQPPPSTSTSQGSQETIDGALLEATDVELLYVVDSDSVTQQTFSESEVIQVEPTISLIENVGPDRVDAGITSEVPSETIVPRGTQSERGAKNIRAQVITEEFGLRRENLKRACEREEELHKLKVVEIKELCHKARIERESAEALLRCNRAKQEKAEFELSLLKNTN